MYIDHKEHLPYARMSFSVGNSTVFLSVNLTFSIANFRHLFPVVQLLGKSDIICICTYVYRK